MYDAVIVIAVPRIVLVSAQQSIEHISHYKRMPEFFISLFNNDISAA
jgi:hypothetical protein